MCFPCSANNVLGEFEPVRDLDAVCEAPSEHSVATICSLMLLEIVGGISGIDVASKQLDCGILVWSSRFCSQLAVFLASFATFNLSADCCDSSSICASSLAVCKLGSHK